MSSAGHIMDMNNRMRANRALLGRRRQRYAQLRELYRGAVAEKVVSTGHRELDEQELTEVRKAVRIRLRRERILKDLVAIGIAAVVLAFLYVLVQWGCAKLIAHPPPF
jgi:hypothetical protein